MVKNPWDLLWKHEWAAKFGCPFIKKYHSQNQDKTPRLFTTCVPLHFRNLMQCFLGPKHVLILHNSLENEELFVYSSPTTFLTPLWRHNDPDHAATSGWSKWGHYDVIMASFIMFIVALALTGACRTHAFHDHGKNGQNKKGTCQGCHFCKKVVRHQWPFTYPLRLKGIMHILQ